MSILSDPGDLLESLLPSFHVEKNGLHLLNDKKFVQRGVAAIEFRWRLAQQLIISKVVRQGRVRPDPEWIVQKARIQWQRIFAMEQEKIERILGEAIRQGRMDVNAAPSLRMTAIRKRLQVLADEWLTEWGRSLIDRRVEPLIREKIQALPDKPTWKQITLALQEALGVVPHAMADLLQPLTRTLLSFAILTTPSVTIENRLRRKDDAERYVIVALPDACPICTNIANSGSFQLESALDRLDDVMGVIENEDVLQGIRDSSSFAKIEDVEGKSSGELANQGTVVPPFHFGCRCGLEFLD
jgi:hypothetical protein